MKVKFQRIGDIIEKAIKNGMGKDIGIAKQVQGQIVEAIPHLKFKGL